MEPIAPAQRTWLDIVRDWLANAARSLLHRIDHLLGAPNAFETAIGFGVIAVALALVVFAVVVSVRSLARRRSRRAGARVTVAGGSDVETASALRSAAQAAAAAGRYRDAAALLFVAAARALDERGRLAYDPARTPGEYRRLLRDPQFDAFARDAVVALFAADEPPPQLFARMTDVFDRVFAAAPA